MKEYRLACTPHTLFIGLVKCAIARPTQGGRCLGRELISLFLLSPLVIDWVVNQLADCDKLSDWTINWRPMFLCFSFFPNRMDSRRLRMKSLKTCSPAFRVPTLMAFLAHSRYMIPQVSLVLNRKFQSASSFFHDCCSLSQMTKRNISFYSSLYVS